MHDFSAIANRAIAIDPSLDQSIDRSPPVCFVIYSFIYLLSLHCSTQAFIYGSVCICLLVRLVSSFTSAMLCARIPGLTPAQRHMCGEMPDALIALGEGHQLGAQECQHQFRGHRWNCSEVWQRNVFAHVIPTGECIRDHRLLNLSLFF